MRIVLAYSDSHDGSMAVHCTITTEPSEFLPQPAQVRTVPSSAQH
jgi:hypothetical protein